MRIDVVGFAHAPLSLVRSLYADYQRWPDIFPLITALTPVARRGTTTVLSVEHAEGRVINELTVGRERIMIREQKRRYDAIFVTEFRTVPNGTLIIVRAWIRLKGRVLRLLSPALRTAARHQIRRWQLQPLIKACESGLTIARPDEQCPSGRPSARHGQRARPAPRGALRVTPPVRNDPAPQG